MVEWQNRTVEERREARKAPRAAILIGTVTYTKDPTGNTGKGKGKSATRYCGEQEHIGVDCPYMWTNIIDEEDDQSSS